MATEMGPPLAPPPRTSTPPADPLPQTLDDDEPSSSSSSVITFKTPMPPPPANSHSLSDTDPPQPDDSAAEEQLQSSPTDSDAAAEPVEPNATAKEAPGQSHGIVVPYTIPPWSGAPSHQFSLEVLKDGSIVDQLNVYAKGAYMFGRVDLCDFVLDHPTISRFHAVLQFKRSGDAYIYDLGSTHGTFINKNQVKKKVYVDLHVGDVIRFGHSSRLYIFQGPSELMPPEKDLKTIRKSRIYEEIQDREASLQRARREASLAEGVSWGMGEDAIDEAEDDIDEVTWQTYRGQLTEKQEKTREKVIKRMEKIAHMKKEIDAIRVKDISQGGLTQGQQTQIARNEQRITQIMEELENLEETLNESIRESIGARSGKQSHGKKKGVAEDDEEFSSDDDEFYDRTKKSSSKKAGENQSIETADTLLDKKDDIMKEIEDKKELLLDEKNKMTSETTEVTKVGDELDAYMSGLSSQLVLDKTQQLEKEISALQSELDRILYLLKIADPTGEAAERRLKIADQVGEAAKENELRVKETKPSKSETPAAIKKQPPIEPEENSETGKPENGFMQKEGDAAVKLSNKPEAGENTLDTTEAKTSVPVYVVAKPQWLGAVEKRETEESSQQVAPSDAHGSDEFVDYKDRKMILASSDGTSIKMESEIENATPGLIIRKRKQVHEFEGNEIDAPQQSTSSSTASGFMAEDAVSLLLKHKRGYHGLDEDNNTEGEGGDVDVLKGHQLSKEKKPKRVLGPEKPSFLETNSDYETWVPPEGQSGDGRTSLNDRFGY